MTQTIDNQPSVVEKLPVELWNHIWDYIGIGIHQLIVFASVNRYFRSLADSHPFWRQLLGLTDQPDIDFKNCVLTKLETGHYCNDCFISAFYRQLFSCSVSGYSIRQCAFCYELGQHHRQVAVDLEIKSMKSLFPGDERNNLVNYYWENNSLVQLFVHGEQEDLYLENLRAGFGDMLLRIKFLHDNYPAFNFGVKWVTRFLVEGKDQIAVDLVISQYYNRRNDQQRRALEISNYLFISGIKGNFYTNLYIDEGIIIGDIYEMCRSYRHISKYDMHLSKRERVWYEDTAPKKRDGVEYWNSFQQQKGNDKYIVNYVEDMCFYVRDFTLPRFKPKNPLLPPPHLWKKVETQYLSALISRLKKFNNGPNFYRTVYGIWPYLDQMVGKGCSSAIRHFLMLYTLPEIINHFDNETLAQIILALENINQ